MADEVCANGHPMGANPNFCGLCGAPRAGISGQQQPAPSHPQSQGARPGRLAMGVGRGLFWLGRQGIPRWMSIVFLVLLLLTLLNVSKLGRLPDSDAYQQGYDAGYSGGSSGVGVESQVCEAARGDKLGGDLVLAPHELSDWNRGCHDGYSDGEADR